MSGVAEKQAHCIAAPARSTSAIGEYVTPEPDTRREWLLSVLTNILGQVSSERSCLKCAAHAMCLLFCWCILMEKFKWTGT